MRFRSKFNIRGPFAVYVGRIDRNKGCEELFGYFQEYLRLPYGRLSLVLVGNSVLEVPRHPRIRHLGFLEDADKFDAGAGLDVFAAEPLPPDSPLWEMDNVILTGHYSGLTPRYFERAFAILLDNLQRYRSGQPLRNVVDKWLGY